MAQTRPACGSLDLSGRVNRLPLSLRRPRLVLGLALIAVVTLGALGLHVESKLKPTSLDVAGTGSSRAGHALHRYFGDSAPFVILLRGPSAALERQGPRLIRALRNDPFGKCKTGFGCQKVQFATLWAS